MYVRLAFAVAAHLEPEILVVDEVLAVGDAAFQKKCLGKMGDVATREGRTVLFVSHNMAAVENFCQKGILLEKGKLLLATTAQNTINHYLQELMPSYIHENSLKFQENRSGNGKIKFTDFYIENSIGTVLSRTKSGMDTVFVFEYVKYKDVAIKNIDIGFSIHTQEDITLTVFYSSYKDLKFDSLSQEGKFKCCIKKLPLRSGLYRIGGRITSNNEEMDWPRDGLGYLEVEDGDFYKTGKKGFEGKTYILMDGEWSLWEEQKMIKLAEVK
jgi:lipopolysaccharide transport system ATP-binding protein